MHPRAQSAPFQGALDNPSQITPPDGQPTHAEGGDCDRRSHTWWKRYQSNSVLGEPPNNDLSLKFALFSTPKLLRRDENDLDWSLIC